MDGRRRDVAYALVTRAVAYLLSPLALAVAPGRSRETACRWALALRFPAEDLAGLTTGTAAALHAARAEALWRCGVLIGVTSGFRDAQRQAALYARGQAGRALPPAESRHVAGTAVDLRPRDGARWVEDHGHRYGFYRVYDNEWWHFEFHPTGRPPRLPHPGASGARLR